MGIYLSTIFRENPPAPCPLHPTLGDARTLTPMPGLDGVDNDSTLSPAYIKHGSALTSSPGNGCVSEHMEQPPVGVYLRHPSWFWKFLSHFPPDFLAQAGVSTSLFLALNATLPLILPKLFPKIVELSPEVQGRFVHYAVSTFHHLVVAPWATRCIANEIDSVKNNSEDHHIDYSGNMKLASFSSGYFVADFLWTLPQALKNPDYFFHHAAALAIVYKGVNLRLMKFLPHFLVCEWSSICLNALWVLRQFNMTKSPTYRVVALMFLALFTITRIVNMPVVVTALMTKFRRDVDQILGSAKWAVPAIAALQFFWWFKILKQFRPMLASVLTKRGFR